MFITTYKLQNCQTKINIPPTPTPPYKQKPRPPPLSVNPSQISQSNSQQRKKPISNTIHKPLTPSDSGYDSEEVTDSLSLEEMPGVISQRFRRFPRKQSAQNKNMNYDDMERTAWNQTTKPPSHPETRLYTLDQINAMSRTRQVENTVDSDDENTVVDSDDEKSEVPSSTRRAMKTLRMNNSYVSGTPESIPETPESIPETPKSIPETLDDEEVPRTPPDDSEIQLTVVDKDTIRVNGQNIRNISVGGGGKIFKYEQYIIKLFMRKTEDGDKIPYYLIKNEIEIMKLFVGKQLFSQFKYSLILTSNYFYNDAIVMDYYPATMLDLPELTENQARFYIMECVEAIEKMHKVGIVHRDIRPINICISNDGHIKIIDFGLALYNNKEDQTYSKEDAEYRSDGWGGYIPPRFSASTGNIMKKRLKRRTDEYRYDNNVNKQEFLDQQQVTNHELEKYDWFGLASIVYWLTQHKELKYLYVDESYNPDYPHTKIRDYRRYHEIWVKMLSSLFAPIQSQELTTLLKGLMQYYEYKRWSGNQVLNSSWFKSEEGLKQTPPLTYQDGKWIEQWR